MSCNSGTNYANPDAATSIGATSLVYDNAGNETSAGSSSFTWDWRGHLNTSTIAATTSIYYVPYGSPRISTGSDVSQRKYIGQFTDPTGIDYLNARYYSASQGQFLSEDPTFWGQKQNLYNPQGLNSYSYADDNPVTKSDPTGLAALTSQQNAQLNSIKSQLLNIQSTLNSGTLSSSNLSSIQHLISSAAASIGQLSRASNPNSFGYQWSPVIFGLASSNFGDSVDFPNYANVFSAKYGYSQKLPRDFQQIKEDAQNGKLDYRGPYENKAGALPQEDTYKEYSLPTPEMTEDLNLPQGTVGPERVMIGNDSGNSYYTGSHSEGDFLDLQNGKVLPGESEGFPIDFPFFF